MSKKRDFEECLPEIIEVVDLYQSRWTLVYYSWQDVKQDILKHIFKKWHTYNPKFSLRGWVARVVQNQIKNALRDRYYIYQPPCLKCEFRLGENGCKMYGEVSSKCPLYKKYLNQKVDASNLYFPVSYEQANYDAKQQFSCTPQDFVANIYTVISGVHKDIFVLFYESGFSTTKIARNIQVSGMDFKEKFDFVKESIKDTYEVAKEILEDKKISMGLE